MGLLFSTLEIFSPRGPRALGEVQPLPCEGWARAFVRGLGLYLLLRQGRVSKEDMEVEDPESDSPGSLQSQVLPRPQTCSGASSLGWGPDNPFYQCLVACTTNGRWNLDDRPPWFWTAWIFFYSFFPPPFSSLKTCIIYFQSQHYTLAQWQNPDFLWLDSLTRFSRSSWAHDLLSVASSSPLLEQFNFSILLFLSRLLTEYSRSSFSFCFWEAWAMLRTVLLLPGHHFFPL